MAPGRSATGSAKPDKNTTGHPNDFWLGQGLHITPAQQLSFMEKFYPLSIFQGLGMPLFQKSPVHNK